MLGGRTLAQRIRMGGNMHVSGFALRTSIAALLMACAAATAAAIPVGQVKTVSGEVSIERAGTHVAVAVGTAIEARDVVRTGEDGSVGISFVDNSRMALGPRSTLAIERFEFDPTTHDGHFDARLRKGTLSAVSGKIAHRSPQAMTVRTRSTLLAVRGTEFVVRAK
jgi:hypothetical protein